MAKTPSNMVPIGFKAPPFRLEDSVTNCMYSSDDLFGKKCTLLMFICNHCPFVIHVNSEIVSIANDFKSEDFKVIAISSNDIINYPQDSPKFMKKIANEQGYSFPYLYDHDQSVAKNYDAACTPDFYIFDEKKELVYRGQLDDSRPGNNITVTGKDIRDALNSLISGKQVNPNQKPSIGCNIKWII